MRPALHPHRTRLALGLALLFAAGCAARRARRAEGRYDLSMPSAEWREAAGGGADHAWFHPA